MKKKKDIKKILEKAWKIALFGHVHPDGDCIGAMLGLGRLLEKQGKKVSYFTPTPPSKSFFFLKEIKKIKTIFDYGKYDVLAFVDFSGYGRIDEFTKGHASYFDAIPVVVIDHHPDERSFTAFVIRDAKCMSTAELVLEHAIVRWPKLFDAQVATYLYLGLTMDSGNFLYDVDHERILSNALKLVKLGADKGLILHQLFRKRSLNATRFMQLLLNRMQQKGDLLYSYFSDHDLKKYDVDDEEANYGLTVIQNIDGPKLVLVLKKMDGLIRGSLRSKGVNCNTIAKMRGGGGHALAAGFSVQAHGAFETQIKKIVATIYPLL